MVRLRQIEAAIEVGPRNAKLKEYGARYSDNHAEVFVAVPDAQSKFSISIKTKGYIAPGLAFFVFMDGQHQCNRNRVGLKMPGHGVEPRDYEIEMRFRQSEDFNGGEDFIAREWTFRKLNTGAADKTPKSNPNFVQNVGTIEIVALRCTLPTEEKMQHRAASHPGWHGQATPKTPSQASKARSTKQPTPVPSKAPSKAASKAQNEMLSGLFGFFDGTDESAQLFEASDEEWVHLDRVPDSPPVVIWTSEEGEYDVEEVYTSDPNVLSLDGVDDGPSTFEPKIRDFAYETPARPMKKDNFEQPLGYMTGREIIERFVQEEQEKREKREQQEQQAAQTDGPKGLTDGLGDLKPAYVAPPTAYVVPPSAHRSTHGAPRADGDEFTHDLDGFVCHTQAVELEILNAPPHGKGGKRLFAAAHGKGYYKPTRHGMRRLAYDMRVVREDLDKLEKTNPAANTESARKDWCTMRDELNCWRKERDRLAARTAQEPSHDLAAPEDFYKIAPPASPSPAQQEALQDIGVLRCEIRVTAVNRPTFNTAPWLGKMDQIECGIKNDPLWTKQEYPDEVSYLMACRQQLQQRTAIVTEVMQALTEVDPDYFTDFTEERLHKIREEDAAASSRLKQLRAGTSRPSRDNIAQTAVTPTQNQGGLRRNVDGECPRPEGGIPATPGQPDWQQVGSGACNGTQMAGYARGAQKPASMKEHFPGEKLQQANNWWEKVPAGWGGPVGNAWATNNLPQAKNYRQKVVSGFGGPAGSPWDVHQNSRAGYDVTAGYRGQAGGKGGGFDFWAGESQPQHVNHPAYGLKATAQNGGNDFWAGESVQPQNNDAGCGGQIKKNSPKNIDRGSAGQQSNAKGGQSGGRSFAREPLPEDPNDLIKPYWKDWDKVSSGLHATPKMLPRPVYTYPAKELPVVPEGTSANATHGIRAGKGADYTHMLRRPVYLDSWDSPYAVISIKYRSPETLKQITGLDVKGVDEDIKKVQKQVQKDNLMQLPKDQLVEQLVHASAGKSGSQGAASAVGAYGKPASSAGGWDRESATGAWGGNDRPNFGGSGWAVSTRGPSRKSGVDIWGNN